jgi:hypothetical protein
VAQLEEKWLRKLIRNCFLQYGYDNESLPLNNEEWKQLCAKILAKKTSDDGDMDLYEIVHDVIYDYMTK